MFYCSSKDFLIRNEPFTKDSRVTFFTTQAFFNLCFFSMEFIRDWVIQGLFAAVRLVIFGFSSLQFLSRSELNRLDWCITSWYITCSVVTIMVSSEISERWLWAKSSKQVKSSTQSNNEILPVTDVHDHWSRLKNRKDIFIPVWPNFKSAFIYSICNYTQ